MNIYMFIYQIRTACKINRFADVLQDIFNEIKKK